MKDLLPTLRSQYTHHNKKGYDPGWLKPCLLKASIRQVSINLTGKKWKSFVLWLHGRAGQGRAALLQHCGAGTDGPRGLKWAPGPWAEWGKAPGKLDRDKKVLRALKALTWHTRSVVQSKSQHSKYFAPCVPHRDSLPPPLARVISIKAGQKIQINYFLSGIFYFLRMQIFHQNSPIVMKSHWKSATRWALKLFLVFCQLISMVPQ